MYYIDQEDQQRRRPNEPMFARQAPSAIFFAHSQIITIRNETKKA